MAEVELPTTDLERSENAKRMLDKAEAEEERVKKPHQEKAVTGSVKVKKKGAAKKASEAFLGEDLKEVKSYLVWDVLIPAIKDTVSDLVKKGIDAMLFGGTSAPKNVRRNGRRSSVSYSDYYDRQRDRDYRPRGRRPNRRALHEFDDIIFSDRRDAENVLDHLVDTTMKYGMASVADFYELAGEECSYTDNKYGWGELADATVSRVREGYVINLPRPEPID